MKVRQLFIITATFYAFSSVSVASLFSDNEDVSANDAIPTMLSSFKLQPKTLNTDENALQIKIDKLRRTSTTMSESLNKEDAISRLRLKEVSNRLDTAQMFIDTNMQTRAKRNAQLAEQLMSMPKIDGRPSILD